MVPSKRSEKMAKVRHILLLFLGSFFIHGLSLSPSFDQVERRRVSRGLLWLYHLLGADYRGYIGSCFMLFPGVHNVRLLDYF